MSFIKYRRFPAIISSNTHSYPFFSSTFWDSNNIRYFVIVSQVPETLFIFSSLFSIVQVEWILLFCPHVHWFYPPISTLLLSPSGEFLISVVFFSFIISFPFLHNFYFFFEIFYFLREFVIDCCSIFIMSVFKFLSDNSNIWFISGWHQVISFFIQAVIFLVLGLYPGHFVYYVRILWVLF